MVRAAAMLLAGWAAASVPAAEPIPLRAGPLMLVFEPDQTFVRHVRVGSDEVLRGISAPVRNRFWGTVPPEVKIVALDRGPDRFRLSFDVRCREREVDFLWHGTLVGKPDGTLDYTFDGEALADFARNRIGFCVLHGETAAGRPWVLETTDGTKTKGAFPERIAPHQPARDLRAVAHEFAPGRRARVAFEGDVFEMEDQRNWTDASFKTYCTPLALPYPVPLAKGTKVRQRLVLTLDGDMPPPAVAADPDAAVTIDVGADVARLPGVGVGMSSQVDDLAPAELERLAALHLDHLRVDLTPADPGWAARLRRATEQARALRAKLVVGLHLGKAADAELAALVAECLAVRPPAAVWLAIDADDATLARVRAALGPVFPDARFGVGRDTNYTELTRNRPARAGLDVASYGLNPQVHAFDEASIVETLPIQAETVRTARTFLGDVAIIVSPVTLRVQAVSQEPLPGELPANVDPRQASPFAAGWTVGTLASLGAAGIDCITCFETVGWKGLLAPGPSVPRHPAFPTRPGAAYPLYHVLAAVSDFAGGRIRATRASDPAVAVLALEHDGRRRLLVANLTGRPRTVAVRGFGDAAVIHLLATAAPTEADDPAADGWRPAATDPVALAAPLRLAPYGIARLDAAAR